jgi:GxxExxY protein
MRRSAARWQIFGHMVTNLLLEEKLTHSIIGAFYDVYNTLGFGFLEHVYMLALERELVARNHHVAREVSVRVTYKGEELCTQRLDMIVDNKVIVEIKSTQNLHPLAQRQLYSYLCATTLEVGLLFHFGRRPGFYRLVRSSRRQSPSRRNLEHVHLPPTQRPDGDVAADPAM